MISFDATVGPTWNQTKNILNFLGFLLKSQGLWAQSVFKTAAEMLLKMKKIAIFEILHVVRGIFQKFQFLENFELWHGSIFLNGTFSIDLSLFLKNNQPELDEHGHDFMPNMPIFQKKNFSKMSPKFREF